MRTPTPEELKAMTDEEVMQIIRTNPRPGLGLAQQALDELHYRFITRTQLATTNLLKSPQTLGTLVADMTEATHRVKSSSENLERLTNKLKMLTWVLIILTALAALVPVGLEIWKVFREANNVRISIERAPIQRRQP